MSDFFIVGPTALKNHAVNPSFERSSSATDLAGWSRYLGVPTLTTPATPFPGVTGTRVLRLVNPGTAVDAILYQDVVGLKANTDYCISVYTARLTGVLRPKLIVTDWNSITTGAVTAMSTAVSPMYERLYVVKNSGADGRFRVQVTASVSGAAGPTSVSHFDSVMIEEGTTPTEYVDGDTPGYRWAGVPHFSASERSNLDYTAPTLTSFREDLGFQLHSVPGFGVTNIEHLTSETAAGSIDLDGTLERPRVFALVGTIAKSTRAEYLAARAALIAAIMPGGVARPLRLRYVKDDGEELEVWATYAGGLDSDVGGRHWERMAIRFIAYNPLPEKPETTSTSVAPFSAVTYTNLITYDVNQGWSNYDTDVTQAVSFTVVDARGFTYAFCLNAAGTETQVWINDANLSNPASNHWRKLCKYNGPVYAVDISSANTIVVGGSFTTVTPEGSTASSVANLHAFIVISIGGTFNISYLIGANAVVYEVQYAPDGMFYLGGMFSTVGGVATAKATSMRDPIPAGGVVLDHFIGAGTTIDNAVFNIATNDGVNLYLTGAFTLINAVSVPNVVHYNRYTGVVTGLPGLTGEGRNLALTPEGVLYASTYTSESVGTVAEWSGSTWKLLTPASGFSGRIMDLEYHRPTKTLWIAGRWNSWATLTANEPITAPRGLMWYRNGMLVPPPIGLNFPSGAAGAKAVSHVHMALDGRVLLGVWAVASPTIGAVNTGVAFPVVYADGTAPAHPWFSIQATGLSMLRLIENLTTGKRIYLDLRMLPDEVVMVDLRPTSKGIRSALRPNLGHALRGASDWGDFDVVPGTNSIRVWVESATAGTAMVHIRPTYHSFDGGA